MFTDRITDDELDRYRWPELYNCFGFENDNEPDELEPYDIEGNR